MDESKTPLPQWLPWATTACLAALVACLGELWILEKARIQLLHDENQMTEAALKGAENQLEAERIVERRELSLAQSGGAGQIDFHVALLSPPRTGGHSADAGAGAPWGVVIWESTGNRGVLKVEGLADLGAGGDYQLWLEGATADSPKAWATFEASPEGMADGIALNLTSPVAPGSRFLLIQGRKGGWRTLLEARASGSIVLATLPYTGKIPIR
jgi:hypothetical protein